MDRTRTESGELHIAGWGAENVRSSRRRTLAGLFRRKPPLTEESITVVDQPMLKRAITAAALGNMMEWFDFGVYAYLATTLGTVFFEGLSHTGQLLATFGTFAAAFFVRPLGGIVFGLMGDRVGRQKVLAATMIMMSVGTFAVGLIPSYAAIGVWAPILLLCARLVQGFSTGGEYGGATTFIAEYSPDKRRGFLGSWLDFGTFIGYSCASLLVTVLNATLSEADMLSWGWRIPFFIAGPMGLIGLYLRLKLEDTPAFQAQLDAHESALKAVEKPQHELLMIITKLWRPLLVCMGLVILYNVTNYMITAYLPTYLTEVAHRSQLTADMLVLLAMLVVVALILLMGHVSDIVGRRAVFATAAVVQIVVAVPAFWLFSHGSLWGPVVACIVFGAVLACFAAPTASTLPALFPTAVRYGALGLGFNVAVSAFGGTTPLITSALVDATKNDLVPGFYLIVSAIVGLIAVVAMRETATQPLLGSAPQVDTPEEATELYQEARGFAAAER